MRRINFSSFSLISPRAAMLLTLALALTLGIAPRADAQPAFTSADFLNTNATTDSLSDFPPEIATDGGGNWVAVWHSWENLDGLAGTDYDIFVATSGDNGATWSAPRVLNSSANIDTGSDTFPAISVNSNGRWIVAWQSTESTKIVAGAGTDTDIFASISLDSGATWSPAALLNTNGIGDVGGDVGPEIANEGLGDWVVVWHSNENLGGSGTDTDIFFATSADDGATWSAPGLLSDTATAGTGLDQYPKIAYGGGTYVVAWHSAENVLGAGFDTDIFVATSADGGQTWGNTALLNTNGGSDSQTDAWVQLASDPSGTWVAVWNSREDLDLVAGTDYDIFVAMSEDAGANWTGPELLNSNAIGDSYTDSNPRIVSNQQGGWVATWYRQGGPSGTDGDIWGALSGHQGLNWTAATLFNDYGQTDSGQDIPPAIASDGNGHWVAAWQSYENLNLTAGTDGDIFVATSNDIDGDSVLDFADAFAMDPFEDTDTDGDGVGNNADLDDDGDGLLDEAEINVYSTDPLNSDSDSDGLSDGDEVNLYGTNPLSADSDGDGLSDSLDAAPTDGGDCRPINPQIKIVWGHPTPFGVVHQNDPGLGHLYFLDNDPSLGLPGLGSAAAAATVASGLNSFFQFQKLGLPSTPNGPEISILGATDPLPTLGSPGSPSLIYLVSRPVIESIDPNFGPLEGFVRTGVNRFNRNCRGGQAAVIVDRIPTSDQDDYATFWERLVENVAHEAGHLYGLRHVLADGTAACVGEVPGSTPAVMDYYEDGGSFLLFVAADTGTPRPITEPPDCNGQETGDDHNPRYHYLRYVTNYPESTLAGFPDSMTPGSWDLESVPLVSWRVQFGFVCISCNDPNQVFYDVRIIEVLPGDVEVVRHTYAALTLAELNQLVILLPESSGVRLTASTVDPATAPFPPPADVIIDPPVYPPPTAPPPGGQVITATLITVEEPSPGIYESSSVTTTPQYEIRSDGTYDLTDPAAPSGTQISASTYVPPLMVIDAPAAVPEPGFGAGLAAGLAGLLALARRRATPRV
ncbi:MAG TPA: hypothetical protein EYQ54_09695 [Myxococcales bacterium]|nr:hypothetical protein [Myxococcales bacterium]